MQSVKREHPALVDAVLAEVRRRGPITSRELETALEHDLPRDRDQWSWNWSLVKSALEHLFWEGEVSSAGRNSQFERRYAAPSVVLPPHLRELADSAQARLPDDAAFIELTRIAAAPWVWAPPSACANYFRLRPEQAPPGDRRARRVRGAPAGGHRRMEAAGIPAP